MAISKHPELFSKIKFYFEDSQWVAISAVSSFTKLTQADQVDIVYNWGNPTTEALAPIARKL